MTLHLLLREHRLALPDDAELLDELGTVRLRESTPGVYRLDHDANSHDDRAVALGLAALALTERTEGRASVTAPQRRWSAPTMTPARRCRLGSGRSFDREPCHVASTSSARGGGRSVRKPGPG
jgi:hypothetical protein